MYQDINNAFADYSKNYRNKPVELFINWETYEYLLRDPHLIPKIQPQNNPVSTVFNCPVYVVRMDEPYLWLSDRDLRLLRVTKDEPWDENTTHITIERVNIERQVEQISIPVAIRDYVYPED